MTEIKKIGRYIVEDLLGEGAMGSVFKARDPSLDRIVAIKIVKLDQSHDEDDARSFFDRFSQEGRISAQLNHHNIVTIHDVGKQDNMPYIAMEYVEGMTLSRFVRQKPAPSPPDLLSILAQIAAALDVAHEKGIVHRDLKPANIMVLNNGTPKIMDFGIAKMSGSNLTQTGVFLGTPSYSSPEQIKEGHVDHRSDIFSFGILACETLTGKLPFAGQSINAILYKIANEPPSFPDGINKLPIKVTLFREIFNKVLHKDPEQRYQTATAFVDALVKASTLSERDRGLINPAQTRVTPTANNGLGKALKRSEFETSHSAAPAMSSTREPRKQNQFLMTLLLLIPILGAGAYYLFQTGRLAPLIEKVEAMIGSENNGVVPPPVDPDPTPATTITRQFTIKSEPMGAQVFLDEEPVGVTPYAHSWEGKTGTILRLKLALDGYDEVNREFTLSQDLKIEYNVDMSLQNVSRKITSVPNGAEVFIDSEQVGKTPMEWAFTPGVKYEIRLVHPGYFSYKRNYQEGTSSENLLAANLKIRPPPGTLEIVTQLEDLRVSASGTRLRGSTHKLKAGTYRIEMSSARYYYRETREVVIESGKLLRLQTPRIVTLPRIAMIKGFARVRIDGVYVKNGNDIDTTPLIDLQITAGTHEFEFLDINDKMLHKMTKEVDKSENILVPVDN